MILIKEPEVFLFTCFHTNREGRLYNKGVIRKGDSGKDRPEIGWSMGMVDCKIISMRSYYCIVQVAGSREEVETVINFLRPFSIDKIARTGVLALRYKDSVS